MTDIQTALTTFKASFNTDTTVNPSKQATNNINAINVFLDSLIGNSADRQTAQDILTTSAKSGKATEPLPSYNVRAPYIEIYINGVLMVPQNIQALQDVKWSSDTKNTFTNPNYTEEVNNLNMRATTSTINQIDNLEVLFQALELSMPLGGVLGTITGTLSLFSRTPIEFLSFLWDFDKEDRTVGLPECKLRFGWSIARTDGQVEKLLTPLLSFLIMNTGITDPGEGKGSTFTLTLQDAGSAVLQNSSSNAAIIADYPQDQLRLLLEGFLGFRLFTLDDLLQLTTSQPVATQTTTITTTSDVGATSTTTTQSTTPDTSNKTFFLTDVSPSLRLNSNIFETTVNNLLNLISCRWYPVSKDSVSQERRDSVDAEDKLKIFRNAYNSGEAIDTEEVNSLSAKVATACCLVFVPSFPASIRSSNTASDITFEETGAYLLLPKITSDYSLTASSFPLIYGPGGSSLPYFYGGAQNVFARLTEAVSGTTTGHANMVGEVINLNSNFSNLTAVMNNDYNEEITYRENGAHLNTGSVITLTKQESRDRKRKQLEVDLAKIGPNQTPTQYTNTYKSTELPKFKLIRSRFMMSIAPRYLVNNVATGMTAKQLAGNKLKHRIGTFLNYPFTISMSVLGDPYLIRQGIGAFEIINYYPSLTGDVLKFNALVSGVYQPSKISYHLTSGDFTTEIQAMKIPEAIKDTTQAKIELVGAAAAKISSNITDLANIEHNQELLNAIETVNLETLQTVTPNLNTIYCLSQANADDFKLKVKAKTESLAVEGLTIAAQTRALNTYKIALVDGYITNDTELNKTQTQAYIDTLKAKVSVVYSNPTSSVDILNYTIGLESNNSISSNGSLSSVYNTPTGRVSDLNTLYTALQQSRFSDIKNGLSKQ